jgi:hypothetical protein
MNTGHAANLNTLKLRLYTQHNEMSAPFEPVYQAHNQARYAAVVAWL